MRRITLWLLSTVSALVLLFSYHTSTSSAASTSIVAQSGTDTGTTSGSGSGVGPRLRVRQRFVLRQLGLVLAAAKTYTGDAVSTRFGDVQVEITVKNGKITKSAGPQVPWNNGKDQEINSYAVPILNSETVDQQSANIDMVSGATYTSNGYLGSLQSAIDQANL